MSPSAGQSGQEMLGYLRSPRAIRERCRAVFERVRQGQGAYFEYNHGKLAECADFVVQVIQTNYPTLDIPVHSRWKHFQAGQVDRLAKLDAAIAHLEPLKQAKARVDVAVVSVLLDAGAGMSWRYQCPHRPEAEPIGRSEGLALASFDWLASGAFSADPEQPFRVDAEKLGGLTAEALDEAFQVSEDNPLRGTQGRLALMHALAKAVENEAVFGSSRRPSGLLDPLFEAYAPEAGVPAAALLGAVLAGFSAIFPGRLSLADEPLGDVWEFSPLGGVTYLDRLVPFHKLSQWLTYSLFEPIEACGASILDPDGMTGLAEYRNGGLFVDLGVISLRDPGLQSQAHSPSSDLVIEWRALTVSLLDDLAPLVRERLGLTPDVFPLAKMLEGGTWAAGRAIAAKLRSDGGPPIDIASDGTVF